MRAVLDHVLRRLIVRGRLTVEWPDGKLTTYVGEPGPEASMKIRDARTLRRVALNPALALGEAYMDGGLVPVDCTIHDVLDVLLTNRSAESARQELLSLHEFAGWLLRRMAQFNPAGRARRNVTHHYDLNGRLYRCSSTATASTPAPISPPAPRRWKKRREPKSATSPPSCCSTAPT